MEAKKIVAVVGAIDVVLLVVCYSANLCVNFPAERSTR